MPPLNCPNCQTIRPPNAAFCPTCGLAFDGSRPGVPSASPSRAIDLGVWTGVKFGAGFAIGLSIIAVVFWVVVLMLIAIGLSLPAAPR